MSKLVFSLFLLLSAFSFSQDYRELDHAVRNYPKYESLENLVLQIQNDFKTDEEQVRAAFVWVTQNISYYKPQSSVFEPREKFVYYSEYGKKYQIRKNELKKIDQTLQEKRGVCIDYSLILNEIYSLMDFPTKIVTGIAKTAIENVSEKQLYKNHVWNAVHINGHWQLMDPTMGSGYWDLRKNIFIRKFQEHYFFTKPSDFIKDHFPGKPQWQLLNEPILVKSFMESPIFYPDYFLKKVELVSDTQGIWEVTKNQELRISFNNLPKRYSLQYFMDGFQQLKRVRVKKIHRRGYLSILKLRKKIKSDTYLTLFLENKPILDFKLRPKPN